MQLQSPRRAGRASMAPPPARSFFAVAPPSARQFLRHIPAVVAGPPPQTAVNEEVTAVHEFNDSAVIDENFQSKSAVSGERRSASATNRSN